MSFFKRDHDLSAYPQPVLVTPDPVAQATTDGSNEDDIIKEVAEAASTSIHDSDPSPATTPAITQDKGKSRAEENDTLGPQKVQSGEQPTSESSPSLAQHPTEIQHSGEGMQDEDGSQQDKDTETPFQDTQDQRAWTDGIMSVIGPVIQEMDFNIVSVRKSQVELEKEIERLTAELQLFMDSAATPSEVEPAIRKLVLARKQITTASTTLRTVQDRVDRMCSQVQRKR